MAAPTSEERALHQTVAVLCRIMESRDAWTAGHLTRVSLLSRGIAVRLGLDAHQIDGVRVGANLHDIGKIAVPAEILLHPGRLSPQQVALVKMHASAGADFLADVEFPWPVHSIVRHHHERLDGSGYPDGLRGDAITLEARIVAVADVVDAMASHRVYRHAPGLEQAVVELATGSGTWYDSDVVTACLAELDDAGVQARYARSGDEGHPGKPDH